MKKEFVIIYCKYVYIKSTFNVINIVLFVSEEEKKGIHRLANIGNKIDMKMSGTSLFMLATSLSG